MLFTGQQQSTVPRPFPNSRPCSSDVSELNTMFSELIPISRKKPTQNWWVFHMFSTLGMPTRIADRSLGGSGDAAEGFFANHVRNVGIGIFRFLDSSLDHFHFVQVFDQSLGAGVIHNHAFPALRNRNLAPLAAISPGQLHVDKAALARHRAPVANREDEK